MNRILIISLVSLLFACESKEVQYRTPQKKSAESGTASLKIKVPGPASFQMSNGNPTEFLNSYLLRITSSSKKCEEFQRYELKDYTGADVLEYQVNTTCDFRIRFALGKESEGAGLKDEALAFDAFYTTEDSFDVDPKDFESGDVEIKLHLKRTTLGEKLGFILEWAKDIIGQDTNDNPDDKKDDTTITDDTKDPDNNNNNNNSGDSKITYTDLKSTIDSSCATCHRPGGSRSGSDLSSYTSFKNFGASAVTRIISGTMPPAGSLSTADVQKFREWRDAGFPEKAGSTTTNNNNNNNSGDEKIVEFRIKSGTGSGAWNTADTQINLKVGQVLKIINDDTVKHRFHTNGSPCPHGNDIQPGKSEDCVISRAYTGVPLYDHNTEGKVYIRAEK